MQNCDITSRIVFPFSLIKTYESAYGIAPQRFRIFTIQVYANGSQMCNTIFGKEYVYYAGDESNCLIPSNPEHNANVVKSKDTSFVATVCEKKCKTFFIVCIHYQVTYCISSFPT